MIIVTGGAGFIGSALVWGLNKRGRSDILIVDPYTHDEQEHNLAELQYEELISGDEFRQKLAAGDFDSRGVEAIFHMGAISATTEKSWEKLRTTNVEFSQEVIRWASDHNVRCIYASSAATYGNGEKGYSDDHKLFETFTPLNLYGKSKLMVDIWARDGGYLNNVVGLRFFNVFGPNEWHKEAMMSVMAKLYPEIMAGEPMRLFKSYKEGIADGEQKRDFVYIKDVVDATLFFMDYPEHTGVFNVGSGKASSWNEVGGAMFSAIGKAPNIEYVDMPADVKAHYQYFTEGDTKKLRVAGFAAPMTSLNDAIKDYVVNYLAPHKHLKT